MSNIPKQKTKKIYAKWWFWILIILILMIGGCGGAGYLGYQQVNGSKDSIEENTTAAIHDVKKTIELEGEIKSKKQADLFFATIGTVSEVNVEIGDLVEQDQVLARIDTENYVQNKYKEITAPFPGIITEINIFEDIPVTTQSKAVTLESQETEIVTTASENEILNLTKDLAAQITFPNLNNVKLDAKINSIAEKKNSSASSLVAADASNTSSGYEIKLDYDKPDDLLLKRDLSCDISIIVDEKTAVLAIPIAALKYDNDKVYVNIKKDIIDDKSNETFQKQYIELGLEGDEYVEVVEGLVEGQEIILFSEEDIPKSFGF